MLLLIFACFSVGIVVGQFLKVVRIKLVSEEFMPSLCKNSSISYLKSIKFLLVYNLSLHVNFGTL